MPEPTGRPRLSDRTGLQPEDFRAARAMFEAGRTADPVPAAPSPKRHTGPQEWAPLTRVGQQVTPSGA